MIAGVVAVLVIDWATSSSIATLVGGAFVVALASSEFYDLTERKGLGSFKPFGMALAVSALLVPSLAAVNGWRASGAVAAIVCFVVWWLAFTVLLPARQRRNVDVTTRIALTCLGAAYVGGLASFWFWIRHLHNGLAAITMLVVIAKGGDLMAYAVGSMYGKHKLASNISPNKSVEGALANVGISMVLALVITGIWGKPFALPSDALIFALLVSTAAQVGDLLEAKVKRAFGAKDSSNMIPGFGGVLDVVDSVLVAAPVGYIVLRLCAG